MKKIVFTAIAIIAAVTITLSLNAQPAGGAGGMMGGGGMGMGGGMMGGGAGMMGGGNRGGGNRGLRARPEKSARLASVKELEKQVAALKAAVNKAPDTDPNIATLEGSALTKFMDTYTVESAAINAVQQTLTSLRTTGAMAGRGRVSVAETVLTELSDLAKGEKATKTSARIAELIEQAQQAGNRGAGGAGMMGGAGAGAGARGGRGGGAF